MSDRLSNTFLAPESAPPRECDLLVVGSGAAGFSAAVTARKAGLDVVMIEKADVFGGTTCYSAGVIWVPGSCAAVAAGVADSRDAALEYLRAQGGNRLDAAKADIYLDQAPEVLEWFERETYLDYALVPAWPDYHPTDPGGSAGGRSLGPRPFDGRTLGSRFIQLRPPLKTTTILGGMMVGREDLGHFYSMMSAWRSTLYISKLFARYARDRLRHSRGTRLSNGNALIAMLARTAFESGVELLLETPLAEFVFEHGRLAGAQVGSGARSRTIRARAGVVLASGGFPANAALRARYFEHVAQGKNHRSLAPDSNTGDGVLAGERAGAAMVEGQRHPAAWTPVSLVPQRDGSTIPFPHFFDRGKAGYIAVNRRGRRFVSEAVSYHDFVPAMIETCRDDPVIEAFLICDAHAIRRFGLGAAPPAPGRLGPYVRSGYIKRASTLDALAGMCRVDPIALAETIAQFNIGAARGEDREFDKGSDVYQRFNGSAGHQPNPCLAPVLKPPFYAIRLVPGDLGTFIGLKTDPEGRALDGEGQVVKGLYVAGNDAASFMGGSYPGAGITLGPALVFGNLAARAAAADMPAR